MATFLGAHITDFSVKGSFGGETSLDVSLADCNISDTSFTPPVDGSPVLFEYESFSYYGIVDTYKKDFGPQGNPIYSVQLTNGAHILAGVELILNDYYGSVNSVPNLINIFGYMENAGGFGGSQLNSAGISWTSIATTLISIVNANYLLSGPYGTAITFNGYRYGIGLDLLPAVPSYYRINNSSINLLDFISEICSAGGHDFFIRLIEPTPELLAFGLHGMFEIVTISRIDQPVGGKIEEFINSTPCVTSKTYGHELRKDVNSRFVVGANVEHIHFVIPNDSGDNSFDGGLIDADEYGNDTVLPFFGTDKNNNLIIGVTPQGEPDEYYFNIDVSDIDLYDINQYVTLPITSGEYCTSLGELRAAKKGRPQWERFILEKDANRFIIVPLGGITSPFKTAYNFDNFAPDIDGFYPIGKYGYLEAFRLKGPAFALGQYPTLGSRYLTYKNDEQYNQYFQRATKLKMAGGLNISFPRLLEDDLQAKSLLDADMLLIYNTFKKTFGLIGSEEEILNGNNMNRASRVQDNSLGNFNDSKVDQLYKRVKGIADNYYNKKFMVSIPFTYAAFEPESNNIRISQDVTNEGFLDETAWPIAYSSGYIPDISGINTLLTGQNKFTPFVKYENVVALDESGNVAFMKYDFSEVGLNDKIFGTPITIESGGEAWQTANGYVAYTPVTGYQVYDCWVKCSTEEKPYFRDTQTLFGPRAVIDIPGSVKVNTEIDYPTYAKGLFNAASLATGVGGIFYNDSGVNAAFLKESFDRIGGDDALMHDGEDIVYADLFAIPLKSKTICYGPWYAIGADGKVSYEKNEELNPWNYGGFDAMNTAGNSRTQDGITDQTFSEVGNITVVGAPSFNFGDVLISGGPYVTDISCSFGQGGVTTSYTFQAWSSHRTLSKLNEYAVDRNKRIAGTLRELKSNFREGLKNGQFKNVGDFYNKVSNRFIDLNDYTRKERSNTSHKMLSAEIRGIGATVVSQPNYNAGAQAYTNYADKAFMSMDGLLRPFSTVEKSGWPSFELPTTSGSGEINSLTLSPFVNGNDIVALAYGSGIPTHGLLRATGEIPYSGDSVVPYRALSLRFPMVGVGWGYDTNGNPVPSGTGLNGFREDYLYNMEHWKAGPVDLRWDNDRGVWTGGGNNTQIFLSKVTNTYNPPNFSYEVERSLSRDQFTRFAPTIARAFSSSGDIYDPEYLAYTGNPNNVGTYEQLNYDGLEFPHYEAFILRETNNSIGQNYYNIWSEDCQDCGHMSNQCPSGDATRHGSASAGKKILIENPLKQNLDAGDLCFTVNTGRSKNVNTGTFTGGSGVLASGNVVTNSSGVASFVVTSPGSGYIYGGFGIINSGICASVSLLFSGISPYVLYSGTVDPINGFAHSKTYPVTIYPTNATGVTESLDIHWIMQAEFKSQQIVTHVACDAGILQTCSVKIQTQGFKSCEWCGEDSALTNGF